MKYMWNKMKSKIGINGSVDKNKIGRNRKIKVNINYEGLIQK